jgi:hypothetical protein
VGNRSDVLAGVIGSAKALASRLPLLGEAIGGYDSYHRARFERGTKEFMEHLDEALGQIGEKSDLTWLTTPDGERFARKVLDCGIDAQLADKKQLFARALVNGALREEASLVEKLKFVDMLRLLSRASLDVLADVHNLLSHDARRPGHHPPANKPYPLVNPKRIAERLGSKYDPYLVEAALQEMQSHGLFSSTAEWTRQADGSLHPQGFSDALTYTDFTCRFVEFITLP